MKSSEYLREDYAITNELDNISRDLTTFVNSEYSTVFREHPKGKAYRLIQVLPKHSLVKSLLQNVWLFLHPKNIGKDPFYQVNTKALVLPPNADSSTIHHELRHALDHALLLQTLDDDQAISQIQKSIKKPSTTTSHIGREQRLAVEVNARIEQAMAYAKRIASEFENPPNSQLKTLVLSAMRKYNLIDVFQSNNNIPYDNKEFVRAFNRIYQYIQ
jgi:hypothetical protein